MKTTLDKFQNLPDNSKVWIYQGDRDLTEKEVTQILGLGNEFVGNWAYHGTKLNGAIDVLYNRFVIIAVDDSQGLGGCSIDNSVAFIRNLETILQTGFLDRMTLAFLNDDHLETVRVFDIDKKVNENTLRPETTVFNNAVSDLDGLRNKWMIPLQECWAWERVTA